MREFMGIDLGRDSVPDATTLLNFRHLPERHELTRAILDEVNTHLTEKGLLMRQGTVVDATIIAAPSSTKNEREGRLPEDVQRKLAIKRGVLQAMSEGPYKGLTHWAEHKKGKSGPSWSTPSTSSRTCSATAR